MQCSREVKGNDLKFGQGSDSRVQVLCFPFMFWDRQNRPSLTSAVCWWGSVCLK